MRRGRNSSERQRLFGDFQVKVSKLLQPEPIDVTRTTRTEPRPLTWQHPRCGTSISSKSEHKLFYPTIVKVSLYEAQRDCLPGCPLPKGKQTPSRNSYISSTGPQGPSVPRRAEPLAMKRCNPYLM
ncbi:hypothetical protein VZT92_004245 [Zoarces viviparus]|uniref:Uncharacterized protein n=1 Tax=Zoarces viviparus TaxID=48416 RepID=A0AAW1FY06_ZOAVI